MTLVDPSEHGHEFWVPEDAGWDEPARTLDELVERAVFEDPDIAVGDTVVAVPMRRATDGGLFVMESYNTGDRYTVCCAETLRLVITADHVPGP